MPRIDSPRLVRCALALTALTALLQLMGPGGLTGTALAQPASAPEAVEGPLGAATLPDGRGYEQVSPAEKNGFSAGAVIGAGTGGGAVAPLLSRASESGEAFFYQGTGPLGEAVGGQNPAQMIARRGSSGWSASVAGPTPPSGPKVSSLGGPTLISSDLERLLFVDAAQYTAEDVACCRPAFVHTSANIFLYEIGPAITAWLGSPQTSEALPAPGEAKVLPQIVGGSAALGVVYFSYYGTLLPEDATRAAVIAERSEPGPPEPLTAHDWALYEYREGVLKLASILPDGTPVAEGALGAASGGESTSDYTQTAGTAQHVVSEDGSRVLFVSPDPQGSPATPPQLYMRETPAAGQARTLLISRSALDGQPAPDGVLSPTSPAPAAAANIDYAYATPDGAHIFFQSTDPLTAEAPEETVFPKTYEYDVETGALTYLPELSNSTAGESAAINSSSILASSADGATLLVLKGGDHYGPEAQLALYADGRAETIAALPTEPPAAEGRPIEVAPVRAQPDGSRFVFQTNAPIPGFDNGEGAYTEVYSYTAPTTALPDGELACLSCSPHGVAPSGNALLSNLVAEGETGRAEDEASVTEAHGVADGLERVFFSTPDALVSGDINGQRDVYEWEAGGVGGCPAAQTGGCRYLISSGVGSQPSFLLDNSASGDDVFFTTADALNANDTDGAYDVYDARAPHAPGEVVGFPPATAAAPCSGEGCQPSTPAPSLPSPLTAFAGPSGNLAPPAPTPAATKPKPKPKPKHLTRAQKLARALAACRKKRRRLRPACTKRAKRLYGAPAHRRKAR